MSGFDPHGEMNRTVAQSSLSPTDSSSAYRSTPPPRAAVSPTVTHVSSRTHTPSLAGPHDITEDVPLRSPSPPRSPALSQPQPTMGSRHGGAFNHERSSPIPQRPAMIATASAPPGTLERLYKEDLSVYSDPLLPTVAVTPTSTSLAELAHLIRLQGYQEQRRSHSRVRLHRWLVSSALSARLGHCGELAHRTLVDNFRSDDKKSFATLYNALHDVRNSCDATRRYALLEPDMQFGKSKNGRAQEPQNFSTFMHEIPTKIRGELLDFLSEVRTNPDFLATRLSNLSQQELASLASFRPPLEPIDGVMARQIKNPQVGQQYRPQKPQGPTAVERLLSFQRHDPLSALIYTIFANTSGPDSAEDLRRTDVWATSCARLIMESKPGWDIFLKSVLDAWAGMREWPGKTNLELYLMQVLQDGQFLLEKAEDSSQRSRTGQPEMNTKDSIAAEEFYESAVKRLFEVIDDEPSAGAIPEGAVEIGHALYRKITDSKKRALCLVFIISRWFFSTYLLNCIIHPETQGIMTGHHISEHARQKILKEIGLRAQKLVLDHMYTWKQAGATILPEIRAHIESVKSRFKEGRNRSKPVLVPAKAIASPRETVEVQPFLVICPADVITVVNSIFPDRRPPSSSLDKESLRRGGLASGASSLSGISLPIRTGSGSIGDASSVLSMSASSVTSGETSREPLLDSSSGGATLVGSDRYLDLYKIAPTEEYGRRLKMACSEMVRILGADASAGSCHPCAERWAVLYVSADGKELRPRMRKDAEDEDERDDDSPDSDSEDEGSSTLDLASDYHALKEAITSLIEEYEIPKELAPESESKSFSNRTSTHRRETRQSILRSQSEQLASRNPYNTSLSSNNLTTLAASQRAAPLARHRSPQHPRSNSNPDPKESAKERPPALIEMLDAAMRQCTARDDYIGAHRYYETLIKLRKLQSTSLTRNGYAALLNYFSRGPRDSLGKAATAIEEFEAWFVWLTQSHERHDSLIDDMMMGVKSLRDKMWYITDVRNSAGYEEAKSVAMALKVMGQPTKAFDGKPIQTPKPRTFSKSSSNNFLLKTEAQVVDLIAAPVDFGGPNKLGDEQSEITARWISSYGIENFCKGEERIHRFCLEVDRCVNKLVGDGIIEGPVLWSSELYRRDKEILDSGRQKGDLFLAGVGHLSIPGDEEYETQQSRPVSRSLDFAQRPSTSSLRSISNRNGSQASFESGRYSNGRPIDLMDSQDIFSSSSPVMTIDTNTTFWSPFQTQAESPTSTSSIRPRTASSSRGTVMLRQSTTVNDDKRRFLLDLKQTLTGLLLSDLGTAVFGAGSETDAWFSGDLAEECLTRKEEEERKRKARLARKKSMKSLKSAKADPALGRGERNAALDSQSAGEYSSSASDVTARSSLSTAKKSGLLEFPYNVAFHRLLRKFATHPNPFSKLHALYELEQIIIASLNAKSNRSYNNRHGLPTVPQSPTLGSVPELSSREPTTHVPRAENIKEAIAHCEERRSHSMNVTQNQSSGDDHRKSPLPRSGTKSPVTGPPSTDMIVDVLQGLFRDANIRPKTLFRDLQFIASFVPAALLDKTARGKAFWDAGLAALGLKQDVCRVMVEIADEIVARNTEKRGHSIQQQVAASAQGASAAAAPSLTPATDSHPSRPTSTDPAPIDPLAKFSMADAARMFVITAKEGDAVAGRELAIFYLTHPDLVSRTMQPLTRPKDVFRGDLLNKEARASGGLGLSGGKKPGGELERGDPITMCVAQHWMEMSKKGGDNLAIKYLRARDEMERIP